MLEELQKFSHKRYNILTGEWVLVSPHRMNRPWQGQEENTVTTNQPKHDPNCYLCPGNTRASGIRNPDYSSTFVFDNDFAALQYPIPPFHLEEELFQAASEKGVCKVVCFSPDHSKTLARMGISEIEDVVLLWQREFVALAGKDYINYVQIFENKGAIMGCSNPHPHGQIWAQYSIPNEALKKDKRQKRFFKKHKVSLLQAYVHQELEKKERVLFENEHMVVLIPFWGVWPFETMILPKIQEPSIGSLSDSARFSMAEAISKITQAYDKLFQCSFPYSSGIHQAPTHIKDNSHWHWHMSFYPPLLRSATVKKFMVGYEMFGMPQRDITPEKSAVILKKLIV